MLGILAAVACCAAFAVVDWDVAMDMPCYEEHGPTTDASGDSIWCGPDTLHAEAGLDSITVMGWRFSDPDTISLGGLPARSLECSPVDFTITLLSGSMGELTFRSRDLAGNWSCGELHYVFAVPAVDSTAAAGLPVGYKIVLRK